MPRGHIFSLTFDWAQESMQPMLELEFLRPLPVLCLAPEGHRSDLHLLELVEPSL